MIPNHVYSSQPLTNHQPTKSPTIDFHGAELRFCSSPSKLQSLMVPSLEAFLGVGVFGDGEVQMSKSLGEPLPQLQV